MRALVMLSLVGCISIREPAGPDPDRAVIDEERVLVESECGRASRAPLLFAWPDGERRLMSPPAQYDDLRVYVTNTARWSTCVAEVSTPMMERCGAAPVAPVMDGEPVTAIAPDGSRFPAVALTVDGYEALLSYYDAMVAWAFCVQGSGADD